MTRIDPWDAHDRAWREARRAMERGPHERKRMLSMNSLGPVKSWYCPICSKYGSPILAYSTSTLAPTCSGSKEFL